MPLLCGALMLNADGERDAGDKKGATGWDRTTKMEGSAGSFLSIKGSVPSTGMDVVDDEVEGTSSWMIGLEEEADTTGACS